MQRALLTEGQSVWSCTDCIGIIKENKDATYKQIRTKVEAAAELLPKVTGAAASTVPTADEATDHSQVAKVEARAVAAEARAEAAEAMVAKAEAKAKAEPLPEVTGESADPLQKAEAAVKTAEAAMKAAVTRAEAAEAAAKACQVTPGESADPCSQAQCCQIA